MNNVLILLDNLDDWKPYYETSSVLTVSDYLKNTGSKLLILAMITAITLKGITVRC